MEFVNISVGKGIQILAIWKPTATYWSIYLTNKLLLCATRLSHIMLIFTILQRKNLIYIWDVSEFKRISALDLVCFLIIWEFFNSSSQLFNSISRI